MLIATIEPNVHYTHAQVRLWDTTAPGNVPRATLEAQYHDLHRVFEQWARIY